MNQYLKTGLLTLGLVGSYSYLKRSGNEDKNEVQQNNEENVEDLFLDNSRNITKGSKVNKKYILNLIDTSISNEDINGLENAIELLNKFINGYEILCKKINQTNFLDINAHHKELKNIRIKVYNNLGCLYQKKNYVDLANENYLKSLDHCEFENNYHIKIIRKNITLLINNDYII